MYRLSIVSPERILYEDNVESVIVPGSEGYLGILSNHAPLISCLKPGKITVKTTELKELELSVAGGFIEVSNNSATVLADAIEFVNEIDIERAQTALRKAEETLLLPISGAEREEAQRAKERAQNRIRLGKGLH